MLVLADRHLELSQSALARVCGVTQPYVSTILSGKKTVKSDETAKCIIAAFARGQSALGDTGSLLVDGPITDQDLAVDLARFAGTAVFGNLMAVAPDLVEGMDPTDSLPTRVTAEDVDGLNQVTNVMEGMDYAFGGGLSRAAVLGQLRHVHMVYRHASYTPQVRTLMQGALARIAKVAGWMAFDSGDMPTARRCWVLGLTMASEADDPWVTTSLLTDMARAAIHGGDAATGLSLLGMAAASASRATATLRTAAAVVTARAHGTLEDQRQCMTALDTAHMHFDGRDPDAEPPWMGFFDEAQLAGDSGQALVPLAEKGVERDRAVELLSCAVSDHAADAGRASALSLAKLARLHVISADFDSADQATAQLLPAAVQVRSARVRGDLRALFDATIPYGGDPAAGRIRHRVQQALSVPEVRG